MQRKFALLALGALVALAIPASAMGSMYPAGHSFELAGNPAKLGTSLGSCPITKVTGTIPAAPTNETATEFAVSTPTVGTCTAGTSMTLGGEWKLIVPGGTNTLAGFGGASATVTMKFTSLPGCKLSNSGSTSLLGVWANGATAPLLLKSGYHAHAAQPLTWSNDGGSCALAGKTETLSWSAEAGATTIAPLVMTVTDTTSPSSLVIVGAKK